MTNNSKLAPLVSLQMFILSRRMRLSKRVTGRPFNGDWYLAMVSLEDVMYRWRCLMMWRYIQLSLEFP